MADSPQVQPPLAGIRVADLGMVWAGAYVTKLLADMGAEVIKVEAPSNMDLIRALNIEAKGQYYNTSPYFNGYNRNKLGVGLDVGRPEGLEMFRRLVALSDVVVENYRADVSEKLGVTYERLQQAKPDIIMLSMQAYGRSGPHRNYAGYGPMAEYMAGLTSMSGYAGNEPQKVGISYGDPLAGIAGAGAIVAALIYRRRTGKGQHIELAQRDNVIGLLGEAVLDWSMNKRLRERRGNRHDVFAPHGCYSCAGDDQWVTIAVTSEEQWIKLCEALGRPGLAKDPRFADLASRWRNQGLLDELLEAWTRTRTKEEAFLTLTEAGVPAGKVVSTKDLLEDPHLKARGFYQPMTHPVAGTWPLDGPVWRMGRTPGAFWRAAPCFGEHNAYVLQDLLGLTSAEIAELEEKQVISTSPAQPRQY